jgi:hypothetical protein
MNSTQTSLRPLLAQATRGLSGLELLAAIINILHNTPATFAPVVYDFGGRAADPAATPPVAAIQGKQSLYVEARANHATKRSELRTALTEGRGFLAEAVDALKKPLGRHWSSAWTAVGFTSGSLRLPSDPLPALGFLAEYLRTHSEREVADVDLTAVKAEAAKAAIIAAQTAVDMARVAEATAKQARDVSKKALQQKVSSLRKELSDLLGEDDPRWYAFGFRRPVDGETPDLIAEIHLTAGAAGQVIVEWTRSRLAENYRVSWKLTGSTDDPTEVGISSDLQRTLMGLPSGAAITVIVTARNDAGDSVPAIANIVVP